MPLALDTFREIGDAIILDRDISPAQLRERAIILEACEASLPWWQRLIMPMRLRVERRVIELHTKKLLDGGL